MTRLCLFLIPALGWTQAPDFTFTSEARVVEVYATVLDQRGRPLDGLARDRFRVLDAGAPQTLTAFETTTSDLSCAILLDTTGSMAKALPVVKNAILRFLDQLSPNDVAAIYGFSTTMVRLQDFTADKALAKKAVLHTRPAGRTALFDAISRVARDISRRSGKKVILVFTDGQDNASVLTAGAAIERAKKIGVPLYTVAQGEALNSRALVGQLKELAEQTGGLSYEVRAPRQVEEVFEDISRDLRHTYLLAYKAPPASGAKWRPIRVEITGLVGYKVRAREGYLPE